MNRFGWCDESLLETESAILKQAGVRIYDGDKKTPFDNGELILTNQHIIWKDQKMAKGICLKLQYVVYLEEESASWTKSAKAVLHLSAIPEDKKVPGPTNYSPFNSVKLSFRSGGQPQFYRSLSEVLAKKPWEDVTASVPKGRKYRAGIIGIERQIQASNEATGRNISVAFEDLNCLMDLAKDMVSLSKSLSQKIKDKQGNITEDETIQFKSYLLSLGIDDPVTKAAYGSGGKYHIELARQLSSFLEAPLKEAGGVLSLTEAYCRINRARGMELISPEDLLNACKMFTSLGLPIKLRTFESGVSIIQLQSHDQNSEMSETQSLLWEKESLTADELSILVDTTIVLAKERLLAIEREGSACRDDSIEGLRFYVNRFLTEEN